MSGYLVWVGGDEWEVLDGGGGSIHSACGERVPYGDAARADHVCPVTS